MLQQGVDVKAGSVATNGNMLTNGHKGDILELATDTDSIGRSELLQSVVVGEQSIDGYAPIVGEQKIEQLKSLAAKLKGARIAHINSTAYGGGVAEILRSYIPLARSLGLEADWLLIRGDDRFFGVTKAFHNALQGGAYNLNERAKEIYLSRNARNARQFDQEYDYVIVHDPQPAALKLMKEGTEAKWVWRCHIDTSAPNPKVWNFLKPYIDPYDAVIYTMDQYVSPDIEKSKVSIIAPAIDPLSPKNMLLPDDLCRKLVGWVGIDTNRPLVTQVSRFDPWKDPLGVIAAYRLVREQVPGLQLAMLGHLAMDDPQGWQIYDEVLKVASEDPDIYLFTNFTAASSVEVNAFQRHSDVVIQKSIREGFGLVVAEALWKGTPVVAGRAGGIPLQLEDGKSGFLVESVEECAEKVLYLRQHPGEAQQMGRNGQEHVRDHYLTPQLLADELTLLNSLA